MKANDISEAKSPNTIWLGLYIIVHMDLATCVHSDIENVCLHATSTKYIYQVTIQIGVATSSNSNSSTHLFKYSSQAYPFNGLLAIEIVKSYVIFMPHHGLPSLVVINERNLKALLFQNFFKPIS